MFMGNKHKQIAKTLPTRNKQNPETAWPYEHNMTRCTVWRCYGELRSMYSMSVGLIWRRPIWWPIWSWQHGDMRRVWAAWPQHEVACDGLTRLTSTGTGIPHCPRRVERQSSHVHTRWSTTSWSRHGDVNRVPPRLRPTCSRTTNIPRLEAGESMYVISRWPCVCCHRYTLLRVYPSSYPSLGPREIRYI